MIRGKTVLGLIPARGGSKGLPRKNLRPAGGKPLIAWTIEAAKRSSCIDRLIVSSDDEEIRGVASSLGCEAPFVRPAELGIDEASSMDVVMHALSQMPRHDYVVLLQPTSPLREARDIDGCMERCEAEGAPACVSIVRTKAHPQWIYFLTDAGRLKPAVEDTERAHRRQELSPAFTPNGAVYVARCDWLRTHRSFLTEETLGYEMPAERSVDVDTGLDLFVASAILTAKANGTLPA